MTTVIVDYNSGNLHSARKAFERMAGEVGGGRVMVSGRAADIRAASRIVLPGVGAFAQCRDGLMAQDGVFDALSERVAAGVPFLGICVGMQMLATWGREDGDTRGFDWIAGEVVALDSGGSGDSADLKIPHMGWNNLDFCPENAGHPVFDGLESGAEVYFVHSYAMQVASPSDSLATVEYGGTINAIVGRENIIGTQFHPEKSQAVGLRLIANFLRWKP